MHYLLFLINRICLFFSYISTVYSIFLSFNNFYLELLLFHWTSIHTKIIFILILSSSGWSRSIIHTLLSFILNGSQFNLLFILASISPIILCNLHVAVILLFSHRVSRVTIVSTLYISFLYLLSLWSNINLKPIKSCKTLSLISWFDYPTSSVRSIIIDWLLVILEFFMLSSDFLKNKGLIYTIRNLFPLWILTYEFLQIFVKSYF